MVIFELECTRKHRFEGWFKDAKGFELQAKRGLVECPVCGVNNVTRVPSGCHVGAVQLTRTDTDKTPTNTDTTQKQIKKAPTEAPQVDPVVLVKALQHYVKTQTKDVGERFAETAIKMHRNEIPAESISGTANKEQIRRLDDEGVTYVPVPRLPERFEN
jgi:hypothetical protein